MRMLALAVVLSLAWAQRCPEPLYVVTNAELRWTAGNTTQSVAAGKTIAACEGDSIEAVRDARISFGYAAGQPQKRELKAGEKLALQLPRQAPPVVRGLAATLRDNLKNTAQKYLGGGTPRAVDAASRDPSIAKRNIYMPLLALGHNRLLAGARQLVLPYAEAAAPYKLTLFLGNQIIDQTESPIYSQTLTLDFAQPLAAGTYRLRLESGNGSLLLDELEVVSALPAAPAELANQEPQDPFYTLWLAGQPSWALEAYQRALRQQVDFPMLGTLVTLLTPTNLEEEKILLEALK